MIASGDIYSTQSFTPPEQQNLSNIGRLGCGIILTAGVTAAQALREGEVEVREVRGRGEETGQIVSHRHH